MTAHWFVLLWGSGKRQGGFRRNLVRRAGRHETGFGIFSFSGKRSLRLSIVAPSRAHPVAVEVRRYVDAAWKLPAETVSRKGARLRGVGGSFPGSRLAGNMRDSFPFNETRWQEQLERLSIDLHVYSRCEDSAVTAQSAQSDRWRHVTSTAGSLVDRLRQVSSRTQLQNVSRGPRLEDFPNVYSVRNARKGDHFDIGEPL